VKFIKSNDVLALTAKGRSSLHNDIKSGLFPTSIKIGPRAVAWLLHEVEAINSARVQGMADHEIKILVKQLHAARSMEGEQ
jgi:prophage regulatory protein